VLPPGEVQEGIPGPPAGGDAPHSVMPPGDAPLEAPMAPAAPMNSSPMPPEPVLLMPKDPTADAGGELLRLPKVEDI